MVEIDATTIARERLRAAGLSDATIATLLERAIPLVRGLAELAELDAQLPEPALTWRPLGEIDS